MKLFSDKSCARKFFLAQRKSLTREEIELFSARLSKSLCSLNEFKDADTLLFYYPTQNEPELFLAMETGIKMGKSIAFPISMPDTLTLDFRCVNSLSELKPGTYKIMEPSEDAPIAVFTQRSLCVVPALAFDERGFRLGYGKGYYDRFLPSFPGKSVGLFFDGFLCKDLPTDTTDIAVDLLISSIGVLKK